ncbi:hypothetical protein PPYR_02978 [Photinus pyralis]|uniref:Uncharacterized protein n=1 Tax=Photinus pyralis TaxID=7054 RepID=A0A1Y1LCK2_PHOPY|nr:uncharacterized protein LOC116161800 [Photinus pyralis]KAB0791178.1 hypothetical protein PPYR_02978 [Photinus pyralis]
MLATAFLVTCCAAFVSSTQHALAKRALLFQPFTILQFTYGVSAPALLPKRSINLSLCLQTNFELPNNISNFYPTVFTARENDDYDLDRHTFYEYVTEILNGLGLNGTDCLLRSICEIGEVPMHVDPDNSSVLEEIVHYLFSPSEDFVRIDNGTLGAYLDAEMWGKTFGKCNRRYDGCPLSVVSLFTKLFYV